ncbi:hypothetical protein A374_14200 [Fictibacillus macauensis ZFHKF-1]|uniref:Uncharacterized protein n=1 Tax=Fictibacillus macauensis ZFHKF-1 TaxID=1196324 RepID=I8UD48_9BACL|nr:hypothetical protein A374_14200 [Fictibacillus macauensis ZFHKF-1]
MAITDVGYQDRSSDVLLLIIVLILAPIIYHLLVDRVSTVIIIYIVMILAFLLSRFGSYMRKK